MPLDERPPAELGRDDMREDQTFLVGEIVDGFGERDGTWAIVDMSLGKTMSSLTACRILFNRFMIRRVLIVAPKLVATDTWPNEFAKWRHLRRFTFSVICGTAKQRHAALARDTHYHIINRENLVWLLEEIGVEKWPYDVLIYDESSRLKEGKKRTGLRKISEFGALAKVRHKMKYVIELTGTPFPGGIGDAWGQAYIIDLGQRLGTTKKSFYDRWFTESYSGFTYEPRPKAEKKIMKKLRDIVVRIKLSDVMKEIPSESKVHYVDLGKKHMKAYRKFERELASEEYDVEAVNRGVLVNKLVQFANGSLYRLDDEDPDAVKEVIPIHDEKVKRLKKLVKKHKGDNMLVAYGFRFDLERLKKAFPDAVAAEDDPDAIKKWNRGEIKMLLAHPASVGHGLNLQFGGFRAVWYGLTASLELYQQFNARLPRPGQLADTVFIHHIVARGTFDERLLSLLSAKGMSQSKIIKMARHYVRDAENIHK
jgi:SNF2 family DNA or RNA helicase